MQSDNGQKKQQKPFRNYKRERICDALPPESSDPVLAYLHKAAWMYGYGYLLEGSYGQILLTAIKIRRRLPLWLRSASIDSSRDMGREMSLKELVALQART